MEKVRRYELLGVLAAVLVGLFLRLVTARNSLVGGEIRFYGCDSFYHIRRALYTSENFPHTLRFDSYLNHPWGFELTWPPLFDQIVAALSLLLGGSPQSVKVAGVIISPILGSLTILLLYLLAKKLFGVRVALLSAFILAIDSKHIGKTYFGFPDHDPMETLFMLGTIILLAYALTDRDRGVWFGAAAGVLLAAVSYTWLGTPIYMIALLIYAMIQLALDLRGGFATRDTAAPLAAAFGVAILLMLPFWHEPWLIPSFLGALGSMTALGFFYLVSLIFAAKKVPWQAFLPMMVIFGYIIVILSYATDTGQGAYSLLGEGIGYFIGGDLYRLSIQEATPLLRLYDLFSLLVLGLVFALGGLYALVLSVRPQDQRKDQLLFIIWAIFATVLMIFQAKFLFLFSISGSILVSVLFFRTAEWIRSYDRFEKDPEKAKVITGIILLTLLFPTVIGLPPIAEIKPHISEDWIESLDWLRENTPPTESFEQPVRAGDYGVLSWWDYGNWILYISERPVVANNFQVGAEDSARFFLAEAEDEAEAIAEARKVRYVVTDKRMMYGKLPAIARWINEDPGSYISIDIDSNYKLSLRFLETVLARLHLRDCSDLGHYRLVYESETFSGLEFPVSEVKVFERVTGAKIAGTTPYDEPMGVILDMTSNQGRKFSYFNSAMPVPVDGHYEIIVPYSTEEKYGTHSVGAYLLGPVKEGYVDRSDFRVVEVSEEDVLNGATIEVDF